MVHTFYTRRLWGSLDGRIHKVCSEYLQSTLSPDNNQDDVNDAVVDVDVDVDVDVENQVLTSRVRRIL